MDDLSVYLGKILREVKEETKDDALAQLVLSHAENREPDLVIGEADNPYLVRWWFHRTKQSSIYLHLILKGDQDRELHDHPWDSTSYVIKGILREHTKDGVNLFVPGDVVQRKAELAHRLEVLDGPVVTLFITGEHRREWGFWCGERFVHWEKYVDAQNKGLMGRGCGEH